MKKYKPPNKDTNSLRQAVRQALRMSAILVPAWFFVSPAAAETAPPPTQPPPNAPPMANAGANASIPDSDGLPGETVTLNGTGSSDPDGKIVSYVWTNAQGVSIATGPAPTVRLPDGANSITLTVTDDYDCQCSGGSGAGVASSAVTITVLPSAAPTANAGGSRTIADSDKLPGERVTLNGSASSVAGGTIVSYQWFLGSNRPLGTGQVLNNVELPDGDNQITLLVTDNRSNTATDVFTLTVGTAPPRTSLASLSQLSPNDASTATALDDLCKRLAERAQQQTLPADEADLLNRCNGVIFDPNPAHQITAVEQWGAKDMNALRTQGLLFGKAQFQGISDHLAELRGGARSSAPTALNFRIDGKTVPVEMLARTLQTVLGGGAGADDAATNALFHKRLGFWLRGGYSDGGKSESSADHGFDATHWEFTGGMDYQVTNDTVLGLSLGYGQAKVTFNPTGRGGVDTNAFTVSAYGSSYLVNNLYLDGVVSYGQNSHDLERHIVYLESSTTIDRTALGSTNGNTLGAGLSGGYDFALGAFTLSPVAGYLYVDSKVDGFREHGAQGLDLAYNDQDAKSSTLNAGLRLIYALKLPGAVLTPHLSCSYVHEFESGVEIFGVRFANDPFAGSANPTPPIIVRSDVPDTSYIRTAAGIAAQFRYDVSGYIEYERLVGFQYIHSQNVSIGLRIQHSFH